MRPSINYEALRLALIKAVKVKAPDECKCKVCNAPFRELHRIHVPGLKVIQGVEVEDSIFICENCVEEFNDYFKKKDQAGLEHLFTNAVGLLMGQRQLQNHTEEDMNDWGNYYDAMCYNMDRNI